MLRSVSSVPRSRVGRLVRSLSTPGAPKQVPPQKQAPPQKKGGSGLIPLLFLASTGAIAYTAYQAEVDEAFASKLQQVPGANYLLDPMRSAISSIGIVPKSKDEVVAVDDQRLEAPKEEQSSKEHTTTDSTNETSTHDEVVSDTKVEHKIEETDSQQSSSDAVQEDSTTEEAESSEAVAEVPAVTPEPVITPSESATNKKQVQVEEAPKKPSPPVPLLRPVGAEELAKATESKVLKQALADSAREYIALRRDVESTLLKDVHLLSEHDLRIRVKQLATEMFERLAWEDMRMTQSLKGVQAELTEKYTELMNRQHKELELEVQKITFAFEQDAVNKSAQKLREAEAAYQKQLEDTVRAQAEGFHATLKRELEEQSTKIQTEFQDELNHQVALLRKSQVDELLTLQPQVQELHSQLDAVKRAADATAGAIKKTIDIHHLSAAVLSLELALSSTSGMHTSDNHIGEHFQAVKTACQGDEVVTAVLNSLPERVVTSGALPLSELQVRFSVMRDEVRKAALAPEAAPVMIG